MKEYSQRTVLHLIDTTGPGGAETVFINLLRQFQNANQRNLVVLRGEGWVADKVRDIGIQPHIIDSKGSFNLNYIHTLRRVVSQENVSLIHSHLLGSNVYGALLALICRKPMIATFHGAVDVAAKERFLRAKFFCIGLGASRIVCVSKRLQQELTGRCKLPRSKLRLIYNGVDPDLFLGPPQKNLRTELGLGQDSILIVSVGNIRPAKGYEYLIDAALDMASREPKMHFVVVGHQRQELFEKLRKRAESSTGKQPNIHWLGFREDIREILLQADVFLLPSVSEGFSISTVEAMMAGTPVVATRSGGPEEIIADHQTGILVPIRNPKAINSALLELRNQDTKEKITRQAAEVAKEKFGLPNMLREYESLYRELLGYRAYDEKCRT
ncbi:glycosyltransferase family 4 protein [Marinobacter salinisoli]|uniref:Glycosyltransferase family 4 protein n=1 Tax=Marinobacter salinisoli TaxID=2769486 RepID=A0ABX7MNE4_9GAMM|nr:glycosyltransferase family 4 protein [Marinobacter salinisoli]QSP93668.1 glycosyltransferase family 4 protein [Marinobacter salinisoli]